MEVVSECPLSVGSVLWQSGPKAWTLTVVAKATFALGPGQSPLAPAQDEVLERDTYWDDDASRSLAVATDLVPFKRRPEVLVVGHAHAGGRLPVASLTARVAVASVDKGIEVIGDRHFTRDGVLTDPIKFSRVPLRWERSAGGPDTSNPVGLLTGTDARFDSWGRCALPNLVPIGTVTTAMHDPIAPVGFGPIAPAWPTRVARLQAVAGTFDAARWNVTPLPEHFDAAYFNAAPRDQQMNVLDGSESLLLEHLHPGYPVLTTRLAPIRPLAAFQWGTGRSLDIGLTCDTLVIDSDRGLAMLAYRGHIALDHPGRAGRIVVWLETAHDPRASVPDWIHRVEDVVSTVAGSGRGDDGTLPFKLSEDEAPTLTKPRPVVRVRTGTAQGTSAAPGAALPFRPPGADASATGTLLPFRAVQPELPFRGGDDPDQTLTRPGAASPFAAMQAAMSLAQPITEITPIDLHEETSDGDALVEDVDAAEEAEEIDAEPDPEEPAAGEALPIAAYPLDRCARIAASLACRPHERAGVLRANGLDERLWAGLDDHWSHALFDEAEHQKNALLKAHDAAYVAQIEDERGAIHVAEYARLLVASERGGDDLVLKALRIPIEASMRIRRLWSARIARDMDLGARVRQALAAERAR